MSYIGADTTGPWPQNAEPQGRASTRSHIMDLFFAFAFLLTGPFQFMPNGMPQFSDIIMAVGLLLCFVVNIVRHRTMKISKTYLIALTFAAYTSTINMTYFIFLKDFSFFLGSLYYIYNASVFIFFSFLIRKKPDRAIACVYVGIVITILFQTLYLSVDPQFRGVRAIGTFANPNQLAYWSWLCVVSLIMLKINKGLNLFDVFLILCLGFIESMALSKAGIICYLLVLGSLPFTKLLPGSLRYTLLAVTAIATIFSSFSLLNVSDEIESNEHIRKAVSRLENIGEESDDSAQGRGYNRILDNPEYLLIGAGEGGYNRFHDTAIPLELHSTIGTLIFSYGIPGLGIFLFLLYSIGRNNNPYVFFLLALVIVYGVVHQNIRFTHFWIFLGICDGMKPFFMNRPLPGLRRFLPSNPASRTAP
jgi:hypothetical protein